VYSALDDSLKYRVEIECRAGNGLHDVANRSFALVRTLKLEAKFRERIAELRDVAQFNRTSRITPPSSRETSVPRVGAFGPRTCRLTCFAPTDGQSTCRCEGSELAQRTGDSFTVVFRFFLAYFFVTKRPVAASR